MERLRDVVPGVIPITPKGSKEERAAGVQPLVESGNVVVPDSAAASWVGEWIEEMVSFPFAGHDDQVDATTQALSWMSARWMSVRSVAAVAERGRRESPWRMR
jgi:predicted phage terminase large subunit-like protein